MDFRESSWAKKQPPLNTASVTCRGRELEHERLRILQNCPRDLRKRAFTIILIIDGIIPIARKSSAEHARNCCRYIDMIAFSCRSGNDRAGKATRQVAGTGIKVIKSSFRL